MEGSLGVTYTVFHFLKGKATTQIFNLSYAQFQQRTAIYLSADPEDIISPSGDHEHLIKFYSRQYLIHYFQSEQKE